MSTLAEQLQAFARERGGTLRYGQQPPKPAQDKPASIGRPQPVKPKADPWIDYTDDYTVWKQGQ